jgi:acyl-CoA synthetase (AMP-forming)/AMP-acid ligase II
MPHVAQMSETKSSLPALVTLRGLFSTRFDASTALIIPGKEGPTLTFAQLRSTILRLSQRMFAGGLRAGDVVSISLANNIEFVTSFIATTWLGAASAPLNPNYTVEEVLFYLEDTNSRALIVPRGAGVAARQGKYSHLCVLTVHSINLLVWYMVYGVCMQ